MKTFTIGTPSKSQINTRFMMSVFEVFAELPKLGYAPSPMFMVGASNISKARSEMLSKWYHESTSDDDVFMFIDSDHTFTITEIALGLQMCNDSTIACGSYINALGNNTYQPLNVDKFLKGECNLLKYGATGFMIIPKRVVEKVFQWIKTNEPDKLYCKCDDNNQRCIPFFNERIEKNAGDDAIFPYDSETINLFLGEDFSFSWLVRRAGCSIKAFFSPNLTHEVYQLLRTFPKEFDEEKQKKFITPPKAVNPYSDDVKRDITVTNTMNTSNKDIVYYCGNARVHWNPNMKDIRGSEQAVKFLSVEWVKMGCSVTVYGNVDECTYKGVKYFPYDKFDNTKTYDNVILWRDAGIVEIQNIKANNILIDMHDFLDRQFLKPEIFKKANKIMFKSQYHRDHYYNVTDDICVVVPNGIKNNLFLPAGIHNEARKPLRFSFTSDYNRGLLQVLRLWKTMIQQFPDAELHIYTGFDLVNEQLRKEIELLLVQKNIIEHGRVDEKQLVKERYRSTYLLYPCPHVLIETDCITVRECARAGCIPIVFNQGVMKERSIVRINGDPDTDAGYSNVLQAITDIHSNQMLKAKIQNDLVTAKDIDWNDVASRWLVEFK